MLAVDSDYKARRMAYWTMLRKAHDDYEKIVEGDYGYDTNMGGFRYWMGFKWGIEIEIIDGNYGSNYNVINEHKFLMFQIKYA